LAFSRGPVSIQKKLAAMNPNKCVCVLLCFVVTVDRGVYKENEHKVTQLNNDPFVWKDLFQKAD